MRALMWFLLLFALAVLLALLMGGNQPSPAFREEILRDRKSVV